MPTHDPMNTLRRVASQAETLQGHAEIGRALDDIEALYEALDPELQYLADGLIDTLRRRLAEAAGHA